MKRKTYRLVNPRMGAGQRVVYDLTIDGKAFSTGVTYATAWAYCLDVMADDDLYLEGHMHEAMTGAALREQEAKHQERFSEGNQP